MPRFSKRKFKRRPRHRRRRLRRGRKLPPLGMPSKKLVRLRYCEEIALDPDSTAMATYTFSANGMWDPNTTGGGHQPLFFDEYMKSYDHYTVIGSKIKVTPLCSDAHYATNGYPGAYGVIVDDDSAFQYTNLAQIIESNQNRGNYRMYSNSLTGANTKGKNPSITRTFSAKKFFQAALTDSNKGTVATNPSDQAFYTIWTSSIDVNNPTRAAFMVEIEYIALLTEPKFVEQS